MNARSRGRLMVFAAAVAAIIVAAALFVPRAADAQPAAHGVPATAAAGALNKGMRKLWEDHITWTRMVIVSFAADLPDRDAAVARLLQNQTDIGNAIKPYYGDAAGNQLTSLLRDHILIAADLLTDAKSGDSAKFAVDSQRWYANADDIATFLHNANPKYWPLDEMKSMMHEHLDLTLAEAKARLNGDWTADVAAYDTVHQEILSMADMLSTGIVQQFPAKFH